MVYLDEVIKKLSEKARDYKISLKLKAKNYLFNSVEICSITSAQFLQKFQFLHPILEKS
mgnify:CR=1 FL=1|jgi:hypothetical protein